MLNHTPTKNRYYAGFRTHAIPGLHDFIAKKAKETFPQSSMILDLGAGSGAMSLQLLDLGFKITAVDINTGNFQLQGQIPFIEANLNDLFAKKIDFLCDGIVAIEVIEHLENPRNFFRECYSLEALAKVLICHPEPVEGCSNCLICRNSSTSSE